VNEYRIFQDDDGDDNRKLSPTRGYCNNDTVDKLSEEAMYSALVKALRESLFREKFDDPDNVANDIAYTFSVPRSLWPSANGGTVDHGGDSLTFGVTRFQYMFWIQLVSIVFMETILNISIALVAYRFIVLPRQRQRQASQGTYKPNGLTPLLLGYGILCPILVVVPFVLIRLFRLSNSAMLVGTTSAPCLLFFRCLEAMYDTVPNYVLQTGEESGHKATRATTKHCEENPRNQQSMYITYCAATVQFDFDISKQQPIRITTRYAIQQSLKFARLFLEVSLFFSILIPCDYKVFPSRREATDVASYFLDLFYWGNLLNNWVLAYLTSICLEAGSVGVGLATSIVSGYVTVNLNNWPLLASSSPSDFWGKRWNTLISSALKRGVFRPMRQGGFSRSIAALATFVASGVLHEYILIVMMAGYPGGVIHASHSLFDLLVGKHLLFFSWNGIVLVLEHFFYDIRPIQWIKRNIPAIVRSQLVVLTVLPVAHLFTDAYVDNGFYSSFAMGFPRLVRLR